MEVLTKEEMEILKGGGDGTCGSPYTFDEFYALLDSNSFYGGYVGDWGYVIALEEVVVYGKSNTGSARENPPCAPWDSNCDGELSLSEANNWYRNNKGQAIVVNASSVDLSFLNSSEWKIGQEEDIQLLGKNLDGFVYGKITVRYEGNNKFSICNDTYDFNQEEGWSFRNFATKIGEIYAGEGSGFPIRFEGVTDGGSGFSFTEWYLKTGRYR